MPFKYMRMIQNNTELYRGQLIKAEYIISILVFDQYQNIFSLKRFQMYNSHEEIIGIKIISYKFFC